ncbi:hypothetical protein A3Q56_06705 [Intoshia linei]|uniref:STAC3-related SH3 domain-containing protein n=1 Tax=Intoshia linei TaxID=1819745 RepID=A0A177AU96_9BILA|nr:hypothetical protein A3Q56_06705 [Intoshia linei]
MGKWGPRRKKVTGPCFTGNCNQKIGYFPSNCVTELDTNEKPVRVKCQIELNEDNNKVFLVPEQIVFKVSDDLRGNAIIRVGKAKLSCPNKYLKDM